GSSKWGWTASPRYSTRESPSDFAAGWIRGCSRKLRGSRGLVGDWAALRVKPWAIANCCATWKTEFRWIDASRTPSLRADAWLAGNDRGFAEIRASNGSLTLFWRRPVSARC